MSAPRGHFRRLDEVEEALRATIHQALCDDLPEGGPNCDEIAATVLPQVRTLVADELEAMRDDLLDWYYAGKVSITGWVARRITARAAAIREGRQ